MVPKSWSAYKIANFFKTTSRIAQRAKSLASESGVMAAPNIRVGKKMANHLLDKIIHFYEKDENSREMPGKNDYVSVKQSDGSRKQVQKRLIYCNLKELHRSFKQDNIGLEVSFSTFAKLRPKHCILAGASGKKEGHEPKEKELTRSKFQHKTNNIVYPLVPIGYLAFSWVTGCYAT